ncbi:MAG: 4-aminobutyrate aminotransferase-like enzyme, partial [Myxococcota bacterium]
MSESSQIKSQYKQHAKPRLAEVLSSIGLDVVYKKGEQDYLEYDDSSGKPIKVLDLIAGYGAGLLGHNHPRLVEIARKCLDEQVPFHAQSSCRESAARLCTRLSELLQHSLNKQYIVHLINTGSEAVEAAVLHCGLAHHDKLGASLRSAESLWCGFKKSACDISQVAFADADAFVNAGSIENI